MWVDVRSSEGRLLFRYDPTRDLVAIRERGADHTIDLRAYQEGYRTLVAVAGAPQDEPYPIERRRQGPIR